MGITTIKWVSNNTSELVLYQNHENFNDWIVLPPLNLTASEHSFNVSTNIPWCTSINDFNGNHFLEIGSWDSNGSPRTNYYIWQHNRMWQDGDRVRYSTTGWVDVNNNWVPGGETVDGDRGFQIYNLIPRPPGGGRTFMQLRPSYPRPNIETSRSELSGVEPEIFGLETSEGNESQGAIPPNTGQIWLPASFPIPTTNYGYARIALFAGRYLPANNDIWWMDTYPDGPRLFPGLNQNQIRVGFRKYIGGYKQLDVWTLSGGTFILRETDPLQKEPFKDPIHLHAITRGETLSLIKPGGSGNTYMSFDSEDLFHIFGGKVIIITWRSE